MEVISSKERSCNTPEIFERDPNHLIFYYEEQVKQIEDEVCNVRSYISGNLDSIEESSYNSCEHMEKTENFRGSAQQKPHFTQLKHFNHQKCKCGCHFCSHYLHSINDAKKGRVCRNIIRKNEL